MTLDELAVVLLVGALIVLVSVVGVRLAGRLGLRASTVPYPMSHADRALADLAAGAFSGTAVLHTDDSWRV